MKVFKFLNINPADYHSYLLFPSQNRMEPLPVPVRSQYWDAPSTSTLPDAWTDPDQNQAGRRGDVDAAGSRILKCLHEGLTA